MYQPNWLDYWIDYVQLNDDNDNSDRNNKNDGDGNGDDGVDLMMLTTTRTIVRTIKTAHNADINKHIFLKCNPKPHHTNHITYAL